MSKFILECACDLFLGQSLVKVVEPFLRFFCYSLSPYPPLSLYPQHTRVAPLVSRQAQCIATRHVFMSLLRVCFIVNSNYYGSHACSEIHCGQLRIDTTRKIVGVLGQAVCRAPRLETSLQYREEQGLTMNIESIEERGGDTVLVPAATPPPPPPAGLRHCRRTSSSVGGSFPGERREKTKYILHKIPTHIVIRNTMRLVYTNHA